MIVPIKEAVWAYAEEDANIETAPKLQVNSKRCIDRINNINAQDIRRARGVPNKNLSRAEALGLDQEPASGLEPLTC